MKLSVIVPVYNVEKYLRECLDSLVLQTYHDMEIIVVNDGSTDGSLAIIQEYAQKYDNLRYVSKINGGLSDARNYGIPYALGEYIAFIDSDDYVELDMYEKMMSKIEEGNDVVVCDIQYFFEDNSGYVMKGLSSFKTDTIQKRALLSPMFAWNKVYHRRFFENLRYPLNTWYEDTPVTTLIFAKCEKIGYVDEALVHYRQRKDSIMGSVQSVRIKEIFNVMAMVRERFKENSLYEEYFSEIEYLHIEHLRLYGMFRFIRSPFFKECYAESEKIMNEYFPLWHNNMYIKELGIKNRLFLKYYNLHTHKIFDVLIKR